MLFLLAFIASAAPPEAGPSHLCEALPSADLTVGLDLADGLRRDGQVDAYHEVVAALETDIECAVFEVDSKRLGRLLWHLAASRYPDATWEGPLTTMVRIEPRTKRQVPPTHPLYSWVPASTSGSRPTYEVRKGSRVVVDGNLRSKYFELSPDGTHLIQYWQDGELTTVLLPTGEAFANSGPTWRFVSEEEQRQQRKRMRTVATGVAGGFAVASLVGGVVANRSTAAVFKNPVSERERLVQQRNVGRALGLGGAAGAAVAAGVAWGVQW